MISILRTSSSAIFALPLPTPNAASAMSTPWACGVSSSSSLSMFTTTCCTLGFASSATLRRVTTTTFLHSGLCTSRCRMCPPTLPVAPSNIAVYSTFAIMAKSVYAGQGRSARRDRLAHMVLGRRGSRAG